MDSAVKTEKFPTSFPTTGVWSRYKNGSYNDVFTCIADGHTWALKKAKISEDTLNNQMSDPERFQRKNAIINPGFHCQIVSFRYRRAN